VITVLIATVILTRYINDSLEQYYLVTRIYNILEYSLLSYLFYLNIKNKIIRNILVVSPLPFILFCIYDFLISTKPNLPFLPLIFEYLILLLFIVYFFFEVIQETVVEPIYHKTIFWISVAFIINFSGNFFLFLYSKTSYNDEAFRRQFLIIYSSVTIIKNILLCIAVALKETKIDNQNLNLSSIDSELDNYLPFKQQN